MSCKLYEHSDYDKLEKAFLCGLPNEVDFSMNVCLLLSNEGKHVMKLGKSKHLLELMLANVGIFSTGMYELSTTHQSKLKYCMWHVKNTLGRNILLLVKKLHHLHKF